MNRHPRVSRDSVGNIFRIQTEEKPVKSKSRGILPSLLGFKEGSFLQYLI